MNAGLSRSGAAARPPATQGRRIALRPVNPSDYDFLFHLSTTPSMTYRWRTRGHTPSPEEFQSMLWAGVLCQFIIERSNDGEPLGLITAYNADMGNGTCYLAMIVQGRKEVSLWSLDALALFLNYLFVSWNLRKVYAETSELSSWTFASGAGHYFRVEGTMPEHEYYDGRYWDRYVLAFWRRDWDALLPELLPRLLPSHAVDGDAEQSD
jgi:RimJ/RimL family protein N-acetyltransferase